MAWYNRAIAAAQGLLAEQIRDPAGEANPEYARGIVEVISDTFEIPTDQRNDVASDIGIEEVY
jgi:hypothetical protein